MYKLYPLLFLCLLYSSVSFASPCDKKAGKLSICEVASLVAEEAASMVPQKISQNITLNSALAYKNTVTLVALFAYTAESFDTYKQSLGITNNAIEERMLSFTKNSLCEPSSKTAAFIELGGEMIYWYKYSDGSTYMKIDVDSCS